MDCDSGSDSGSVGGAARSVEFVTYWFDHLDPSHFLQSTLSLDKKNLGSSDQDNSAIFIQKTLPSTGFCPSDPAPSRD